MKFSNRGIFNRFPDVVITHLVPTFNVAECAIRYVTSEYGFQFHSSMKVKLSWTVHNVGNIASLILASNRKKW
jgi:hypothetical protein